MATDYRDNFAAWCRDCVKVTDKESGLRVPFVLNAPQRRLAREMERQRKAGKPVRVILLKARQWGGSTLVQAYMAWMQLVKHKGWNAMICAHVKDAAAAIRGTYSAILRDYPGEMKVGDPKAWSFLPFEKSQGISRIAARDCLVAVASAQAPDALRGGNYFMAHLSEAAFWKDLTPGKESESASAIIRTVCGTIPLRLDTLIVLESTANGKGNFFHSEWERAVHGKSAYTPVFVPWHEIELYDQPVTESEWRDIEPELTEYEMALLRGGLGKSRVAWYHFKRREYSTDEEMMAEFPGTPDEAFATSGSRDFSEKELPEVSDPDGEAADLVAFCPGHGGVPSVITAFSLSDRGVCAESDNVVRVPLAKALDMACEQARGTMLMIVDTVNDEGVSHGRWCSRKAESRGARLFISAEDAPLVSTAAADLSEMIDFHHEALAAGRLRETNPEALAEYGNFRRTDAWRYPLVLNRLAALRALLGYDPPGGRRLRVADFLPLL